MQISKSSQELLERLHKNLPFFMPKKNKDRFLNIISMNAACVCYERNDDLVSSGDVFIGIFRFLDERFQNLIISKLKINANQISKYRQKARNLDLVSVDRLVKDLITISNNCGAIFNLDKFSLTLNCFKEIFEENPLYIKTSLKDINVSEMYIRNGHPGKMIDFISKAKDYGLQDLTQHPSNVLLDSICKKIKTNGLMADLNTEGKIQKIYSFHAQHPSKIKKITKCTNIPLSIDKNINLLNQLGFTHFAISGVDFVNQSVNLYFHLKNPNELSSLKIESILIQLGFVVPSFKILNLIQKSAIVHFTFTHDSPKIERVCFTYVTDGPLDTIYEVEPSVKFFFESPIKAKKRNVFFGFAFNKNGYYLKPEIDYKGTINLPNFTSFSGLMEKTT